MRLPLKVEGNRYHHDRVVKVLQDIFEVVTNDMMTDNSRYDTMHAFADSFPFIISALILMHSFLQNTRLTELFPANG